MYNFTHCNRCSKPLSSLQLPFCQGLVLKEAPSFVRSWLTLRQRGPAWGPCFRRLLWPCLSQKKRDLGVKVLPTMDFQLPYPL